MSAPQTLAPGSLFGLPGFTQYSEQREANDGTITTLAQAAQATAQFSAPFKQTDIVQQWRMDVIWTNTITPGTSAITTSDQFPYNVISLLELNVQNQFSTYKRLNGFYAAWLQMVRPQYRTLIDNVMSQNITTSAYSAQPNLLTATNYASTSASIRFSLDLTPGVHFDEYWERNPDGSLAASQDGMIMPPTRQYVGYQFMASSARIIQPNVVFSAISGATLDTAPFNIGTGTGTGAGSVKMAFRRKAILQPTDPAHSPVPLNWQYTREAQIVPLGGVSNRDIPITYTGQLLSLSAYFYDPSAAGGLGAPIDVTTIVTECDVTFGPGLPKYQDTPRDMQERFTRQHGFIPVKGMLVWDMAVEEPTGRLTNKYALITLNTSGCTLSVTFTGALSTTAYVVLIYEGLKYLVNS